jgi:hypothetical protein
MVIGKCTPFHDESKLRDGKINVLLSAKTFTPAPTNDVFCQLAVTCTIAFRADVHVSDKKLLRALIGCTLHTALNYKLPMR